MTTLGFIVLLFGLFTITTTFIGLFKVKNRELWSLCGLLLIVCIIGLCGYLADNRGRPIKPTVLKSGYIYDVISINNNYVIVELHSDEGDGILLKLDRPDRVAVGKSYIVTKVSELPDGIIWTDRFQDKLTYIK
ncbi:MAG: hypothetical protein M3Q80_01795 [bacterium]|nr:hypothetical protein [bacterium]